MNYSELINNTDVSIGNESVLVGSKKCLEMISPFKEEQPSLRTFIQWRLDGLYPSIKIGRRVFLDPVAVRKALAKRFTINAID